MSYGVLIEYIFYYIGFSEEWKADRKKGTVIFGGILYSLLEAYTDFLRVFPIIISVCRAAALIYNSSQKKVRTGLSCIRMIKL